ncbi:MAG: ribosomal protein S18-alanine N-acetyltransferase [Acidobacteriota bacterium]|nr:ribosomal protein S18-alanine N-acetyltransferase [Acidobacteriota bacterium]
MADTWDVIRIDDESHIDELVEINMDAFTHPWTRAMFLEELSQPERSFLLAALSGGRHVVGYCSVWRVLDNLQVNSIAVTERYRGRGVGLTLLKAVVSLARNSGVVSISLEVRSSNIAARALYRRLAFKETGQRVLYYSQPIEDAVILSRRLESPRAV